MAGIQKDSKEWNDLVHSIGVAVDWDFQMLNDLYLDCLTDINFYSERKQIEPFLRNIENGYDDDSSVEEIKIGFSKSSISENYQRIKAAARSRESDMVYRTRHLNENSTGKWRAEVAGVGENTWSRNAMTYDTPDEAKQWLDDLSGRWFGYDMSRVVPDDTPDNERVDPNDPAIYQNYRKK